MIFWIESRLQHKLIFFFSWIDRKVKHSYFLSFSTLFIQRLSLFFLLICRSNIHTYGFFGVLFQNFNMMFFYTIWASISMFFFSFTIFLFGVSFLYILSILFFDIIWIFLFVNFCDEMPKKVQTHTIVVEQKVWCIHF